MRFSYFPAILGLTLAACGPQVPDSGKGVGFDSYSDYEAQRAARESQLRGGSVPPAAQISSETTTTGANPQPDQGAPLTAQTQQTARAPQPEPSGPAGSANSPAISDEQDFTAVSARETIESDRERLERQKQQYVVIQPTAVPTGKQYSGPNIVQFALSTTNNIGQPLYSRSKIFAQSRFNRNCAKFPSPDLAQEAFLKAGGPKRDPKGLDPDGDGFACSWDPRPFRAARNGG